MQHCYYSHSKMGCHLALEWGNEGYVLREGIIWVRPWGLGRIWLGRMGQRVHLKKWEQLLPHTIPGVPLTSVNLDFSYYENVLTDSNKVSWEKMALFLISTYNKQCGHLPGTLRKYDCLQMTCPLWIWKRKIISPKILSSKSSPHQDLQYKLMVPGWPGKPQVKDLL